MKPFPRRGLLPWFVAVVAVCSLTGCPSSNTAPPKSAATKRRIVLLTNGNSPFWDAARAGLQNAERDFKLAEAGFSAVMEVNDGTPAGQLDKLRQFGSQGDVAAVGISVVEAQNVAVAEELRNLRKNGVHIVTIDSDLDPMLQGAREAYLGTNNIAGGKALGQTAKALQPDGGEFVTFVGVTGAQNARERVSGFAQGAGEKFTSKDNMGDDMDRTRARENVRNAIINHPQLSTLVGIWSYNAPAIVDIVREMKVRDRFKVVVFDAEPLAIEQMAEGDIDAMVVQNPYQMGYAGVRLMKALAEDDQATIKDMLPNFGQPGGEILDTGLKVVAPDESTALTKELFAENVEFLNLGEFREWLKKYNLSGS